MMKLKLFALLLVAVFGAAAVHAQATPESTPDATAEASATQQSQSPVVITLERTACFGRCPVYTISILEDGTVLYNGGQFVDVTGEQTSQIDPATVQAMIAGLEKAGYFDLRDTYDHMDVTDMAYVTTSAVRNGETHTVRHYLGDHSAPVVLRFLENWIDLMAGTPAFTGAQTDISSFSNGTDTPVITLQRDPCFGNCPVYSVALYADGTVIYTGLAHVDHLGVITYKVDPLEVEVIAQKAQALGFFNWKEEYTQMAMTDQAYVTTFVRVDDQQLQIRRYDGDPNAPVGLTWIEENIDQLVARAAAA